MEYPVTYEAYAEMLDDGQRYEVLDGQASLRLVPGQRVIQRRAGSEAVGIELMEAWQVPLRSSKLNESRNPPQVWLPGLSYGR